MPSQWPIVKRALDRRKYIILPDGWLQVPTKIYAENAAHAVLLAIDRHEESAGQIYNVSDDRQFNLLQVVQIVEEELRHEFEIVNLPYALAKCARPLVAHHVSDLRAIDASEIRYELGLHGQGQSA